MASPPLTTAATTWNLKQQLDTFPISPCTHKDWPSDRWFKQIIMKMSRTTDIYERRNIGLIEIDYILFTFKQKKQKRIMNENESLQLNGRLPVNGCCLSERSSMVFTFISISFNTKLSDNHFRIPICWFDRSIHVCFNVFVLQLLDVNYVCCVSSTSTKKHWALYELPLTIRTDSSSFRRLVTDLSRDQGLMGYNIRKWNIVHRHNRFSL